VRILIDMNLTPRWCKVLETGQHEAFHWSSIGPATASDHEICEYARYSGLVVLTNDLDFPQILAHTRASKPSIIILRGEPLIPEARGTAVLNAIRECRHELGKGAILSLDWSAKPRARLLPLW
jgi:predicted nuclease of predicted toxin-antitoxin system